jgi:small subunit ribosomal protein S3Ae
MAKKRKIQTTKTKKKKWYVITAPKNLNETSLGEAYVSDPEKLQNKTVSANLSTITHNMRDQNKNLTFIITKVKDKRAQTKIIKYKILDGFIKRFVRRDKSKIADSFITKDKNKNRLRVKPLIITHNLATKAQQRMIRKKAKDEIKQMLTKNTIESAVDSLIKKEFQRALKKKLEKIMPIRYAEIKFIGYDKVKLLSVQEEVVSEEKAEEIKEEKTENKEEAKKETTKENKKEE